MKRHNGHDVKTRDEVKQEFFEAGISIKDWAKEHGFSHWLVYTVLNSERQPTRGKSHKVAVMLGLKKGRNTVGVTA